MTRARSLTRAHPLHRLPHGTEGGFAHQPCSQLGAMAALPRSVKAAGGLAAAWRSSEVGEGLQAAKKHADGCKDGGPGDALRGRC